MDEEIRRMTLRFMRDYGLYPGDALHAATAAASGVMDLATIDFDFNVLPATFAIWRPDAQVRRLSR